MTISGNPRKVMKSVVFSNHSVKIEVSKAVFNATETFPKAETCYFQIYTYTFHFLYNKGYDI